MATMSDLVKGAVDQYMSEAKLPKTFTDKDIKNFKLMLGFKFQMDLEGLKEKDLGDKQKLLWLEVEVLKVHINNALYKECLKAATWKKANLVITTKDDKGKSKAKSKKKGKSKDKGTTIIYIRRRSRAKKLWDDITDKIMGTALDFSIWVNDCLNGIQ